MTTPEERCTRCGGERGAAIHQRVYHLHYDHPYEPPAPPVGEPSRRLCRSCHHQERDHVDSKRCDLVLIAKGGEHQCGCYCFNPPTPTRQEATEAAAQALRKAEWSCVPGSGYCPVCGGSRYGYTEAWNNGKTYPAGHKDGCLLAKALALLERLGGRDGE